MQHLSSRVPGRPNRFQPQIEALEGREVPAVVWATPVTQGGVVSLVVLSNAGNDTLTVLDSGNSNGAPGNLRITALNDPIGQSKLDFATAHNFITNVYLYDSGGSNRLAYNLQAPLAPNAQVINAREIHAYLSGPSNGVVMQNRFDANIPGLLSNAKLKITCNGSDGSDHMRVNVRGTLWGGSQLGIELYGMKGPDVIGLDTTGLNIAHGALLWTNLSGNAYQTFNDTDAGNNVQLWYSGRMDGRLQYDIMGSGGADILVADLYYAAGSSGTVGNRDPYAGYTTQRIAGGAGNDYIYYGSHSLGATFLDHSFGAYVDGGGGWDYLDANWEAARTLTMWSVEYRPGHEHGFVP
jgi:hypothetical protein